MAGDVAEEDMVVVMDVEEMVGDVVKEDMVAVMDVEDTAGDMVKEDMAAVMDVEDMEKVVVAIIIENETVSLFMDEHGKYIILI